MAARHKMMKMKKAKGGEASPPREVAAGWPQVIKEAEEKKRGGKVHHVEGKHAKHRLDRPGRKRGGRVGADMAPLSSANRNSKADMEPKSNSSE